MMPNLMDALPNWGIRPRGVVHVGAHEGQEADRYAAMGIRQMLMIEANPAVFARLQARLGGRPGIHLAQVAISDRPGSANFNVTSFDQSSSLLPLKHHRQLYPQIEVVDQVQVRTQTLDGLLAETGLAPAAFDLLHMDIQGAELLALQGADALLANVQAISCEVNFAELYEGGALIDAIELKLAQHGLHRVALATPYHPSWGDALYVRRPLVGCSTLGRNGRLGNQLFQYAFARLMAEHHGAVLQTPPWIGRQIFGLQDQDQRIVPRCCDESTLDDPRRLLDPAVPLAGSLDLLGWFQLHGSAWRPYADRLRTWFRFAPGLLEPLDNVLSSLRGPKARPIIAVHLRRGDYGYRHFFRSPATWYREWVETVARGLEDPLVYLCSEDPLPLKRHFAGFDVRCAQDLRGIDPELAVLLDFHMMTRADALAISNSSFSYMAALLNERARSFARPSLDAGRLVDFDPWNSPVLLPRELRPGEQAALDAIDLQDMPHRAVAPAWMQGVNDRARHNMLAAT